jgi:thiopeptide-type bacteriocin biosynthesis protein
MKNLLHAFDFYLLRLPVLPLSGLAELHAHQHPADFARAVHQLYQAPELQEAIYLASPELHQQLLKWLAKPAAAPLADDERLVLTLYKYLLRMSSRCTPYGLFAGFHTGRIAAAPTRLQLAEAAQRRHKHARLDMNYVAELTNQLIADPELQTQLRFFVNSSLYKTQDAYRYYEYQIRNKRRQYHLVSLRATTHLATLLAAAGTPAGATHAELHGLLTAAGVAAPTATRYLTRLLEAQVLHSELEPTVTGPEFFDCLVAKVAAIAPAHASLAGLRAIQAQLRAPHTGVPTYQAIEGIIKQAFPAASSASKDLIQTDLRLNLAHHTLNAGAVGILAQDLSALAVLGRTSTSAELRAFTKSFTERYEEQEIPLLEALDGEAGLGYGAAASLKANHTPLVDNVRVPAKAATPQVNWSAYRQLVFRKFEQSQQLGQPTVLLTDADLAALASDKPAALPATSYALGSLVAASAHALDQGDFKFQLAACQGPGAMPLLARFAHADAGLAAQLVACGEHEQAAYGDALLAEVVHLPEARVGNILQRPQLRAYEIPFLGTASVPAAQQIDVADLRLSVRNGQLVLRSARLGKVILPRLTTAHNYAHGLPIYRLLCDLQQQEETAAALWDWGVLREQPYLPRIEYNHVIVSRARWRVPAEAHAACAAARTPEAQAAFRQAHQLPTQVVLADGDNELLLDFACPLAMQLLAQRLKKGPATLYEFVHGEASQLLTDEHQASYVNEVIIPFTARRVAPTRRAAPLATAPEVRRTFALGSEWTYVKIYCGAKWADKILADYLLPCLTELEELGLVKKWFFIRYADPKPHLRLRFLHNAEPSTIAFLVGRLHQALAGLQEQRVVRAIQYDTYQRELERYGAATMEFSETFFHHDSRAVLRFVSLLEGEAGERYRWLFAVRGVDQLLTDFGYSLPEKAALAAQCQQAFFQEFNGNADLTRRLNDKYREVSRPLASFLDPALDEPELAEAHALFAERSAALRAAYQELLATTPAAAVRPLLPSYLHMFMNRIFLANQRLHELVVYHYLVKHYAALTARARRTEPVPHGF